MLTGAALLLFLHVAIAADCSGDAGANPWAAYAWELRQAVCGNGSCNALFEQAGSKTACDMQMPFGGGWMVSWTATDSAGNYANCWGASENVINQCFSSGSYEPTSNVSTGIWQAGSESYNVTIALSQALEDTGMAQYDEDGDTGTMATISDPAPPPVLTMTTSTTSTSASTSRSTQTSATAPSSSPTTLTCAGDCRGWVPDPDWCGANCPCFTANTVC